MSSSQKRLEAFLKAKDCFELAELDLQLRGPGEMFGSEQSGFNDLQLATLGDWKLASDAKIEADNILSDSKWTLRYPLLAKKIERNLESVHLE